jgi:hypothetical protein
MTFISQSQKIGKPNNLKDFDRKKPKGLNRI